MEMQLGEPREEQPNIRALPFHNKYPGMFSLNGQRYDIRARQKWHSWTHPHQQFFKSALVKEILLDKSISANCIYNHNLFSSFSTFRRNVAPQLHIHASLVDCRSADKKNLLNCQAHNFEYNVSESRSGCILAKFFQSALLQPICMSDILWHGLTSHRLTSGG